jgi:hypothetical protein
MVRVRVRLTMRTLYRLLLILNATAAAGLLHSAMLPGVYPTWSFWYWTIGGCGFVATLCCGFTLLNWNKVRNQLGPASEDWALPIRRLRQSWMSKK